MLRAGPDPASCNAKVLITPPAEPVTVAVWLVLTVATFAVNDALVAPAETVTFDGTVTAALLLDNETANPLAEAALPNVTVQASVPAAE